LKYRSAFGDGVVTLREYAPSPSNIGSRAERVENGKDRRNNGDRPNEIAKRFHGRGFCLVGSRSRKL
jgi:hypothetical protein